MPAYSRITGRPRPAHVLGSLLALLGPSACFDPDTAPLDGGEASTGVVSTTGGPESTSSSDGGSATSTTSGSSGAQDSSSGAVTGVDTSTDGTSTGEPVLESSSGGESSSSGGESSTGEPPPPDAGYGDCNNNPPAAACLPDEQCIDFGTVAVCAEQGCVAPGDCAVPSTGNPNVSCNDLDGNGVNDCYLDCSVGQLCPDGMVCYGFSYCMWSIAPGMCPDLDIGNAVPQSIMGDNTGLGDDHFTSCGNGGGEDATYQFTAPFAGTFVFDTFGTAYDTILAVLDGCGGAELACNDDTMTLQSQVMVPLAAGQTVIIVVDGYSGATGPFTLNITAM